jgi:hypothetical protein
MDQIRTLYFVCNASKEAFMRRNMIGESEIIEEGSSYITGRFEYSFINSPFVYTISDERIGS